MTIFKQYSSKWGKKNYNGSSSIAAAACGPFSVANCVVEFNPKLNPMDVVRYMQTHGYAVRNHGTAWSGIPAAMKAFGMTDVHEVDVSKSMAKVWDYMSKGYEAVFLFSGGSRGGICWTTGGHYVAIVGYKIKDGKHYLKAKDSGGRDHDGWYAYETTMRGLIPKVWVGKKPGSTPTPTPPKKVYPKCIDVSEHQGAINWKKVRDSGIDYAIIRVGYGKNNIDKHFAKNISEAIKAGLKVGVYWFSYAYTDEMVAKEVVYLLRAIAPYRGKISLGAFFDYEYDSMNYAAKHNAKPSKATLTRWHKIFCEGVKKGGIAPGFYYNYDYKCNHINIKELPYRNWYALYDTNDKQTDCYMQQYSSKGKVNGISGNVDMNWLFWAEPGPAPKPTPSKKLKVDGEFGKETIKAMQKWVGTTQDGICGAKTTKKVQAKVGTKIDGRWGRNTTRQLQSYLWHKGYHPTDSSAMDKQTVMALQEFLNKEVLK